MTMARRVEGMGEGARRRGRRGVLFAVGHASLRVLAKTWVLWLAVLAGMGAHAGLSRMDSFRVRQVAVRNNQRALAEDVLRLSGVSAKDNLFAVDEDRVARRVEEDPWVSRAAVYRRLPGTLVIEVSEYEPVLAANFSDHTGALFLLDEEGLPFKEASADEAKGLPVLSGLSYAEVKGRSERAKEGLSGALALVRLSRGGGRPALAGLSEIEVLGEEGGLTAIAQVAPPGSLAPVAVLRMGGPPYEKKWRELQRLLADLDRRGVLAREIHFVSETKAVAVPAVLEAKI